MKFGLPDGGATLGVVDSTLCLRANKVDLTRLINFGVTLIFSSNGYLSLSSVAWN